MEKVKNVTRAGDGKCQATMAATLSFIVHLGTSAGGLGEAQRDFPVRKN